MSQVSLGKAYVQILPSAKGIKNELISSIGPDISSAGEAIGAGLGGKIKGALVKLGLGAAVASVFKTAISEGSKLEQSIGGVETLFKSSASKMKGYANDAFKTAGLSANDYMEQATSFAAGLIQSCGGDTAKAADVANLAMIDMSDNMNKMGSNMEDIQNAYQGFSKQNYTMLDNLKLGYGGTKSEMERLLADAQKLTGVKYDINNLSDVYNAIHAIQENLDITGTTAEEASTTFSGSFNQMKAAAQNVLGFMANGMDIKPALNDLASSASTFLFGNCLPMVGRILKEVPGAIMSFITTAIPLIAAEVPKIINAVIEGIRTGLPQLIEQGKEMIKAIHDGMAQNFPQLTSIFDKLAPLIVGVGAAFATWKVGGMIQTLVGHVSGAFGAVKNFFGLLSGGSGLFSGLGGAISSLAGGPIGLLIAGFAAAAGMTVYLFQTNEDFRNKVIEIWEHVKSVFTDFCQGIVDRINDLGFNFEDITQVIQSVWQGLCDFLAPVLTAAMESLSTIIETTFGIITGILDVFIGLFTGNWDQCWQGVREIFGSVFDGICQNFQTIGDTLISIADVVCGWFGTTWNDVWTNISTFFTDTWTNISTFFQDTWNGLCDFCSGAWDTLQNLCSVGWQLLGSIFQGAFDLITVPFQLIWQNCSSFLTQVWNNIVSFLTGVWNNISSTLSTVFTGMQNTLTTIWNAISSVTSSIWNAISSILSGIWNTISSLVSGAVSTVQNLVSSAWNAISGITSSVWNAIKSVISGVVNGIQSAVSSAWNAIQSITSSVFRAIQGIVTGIWNGIKSAIEGPINQARDAVSSAVNLMSSIISGANFTFPHIKLPRFTIRGSFSLNPLSVPHLAIEWYAKAMGEGMILNDPTIFGMGPDGRLLGGGEAGPEAVIGVESLRKMIRDAVEESSDSDGKLDYQKLETIVKDAVKSLVVSLEVKLNDRVLARELAKPLDKELAKLGDLR